MILGMEIIADAGRFSAPQGGQPNDWVEHMASADLSIGTYCIPVGGVDDQQPHTEDEVYVVRSGRAVLTTPSGSAPVGPGSVVFVPAGEPHRFTSVTEDLAMVVVFAPPYGARR
jgi:mannose-6-phosphate isomerase-like protein (cupin superfamily)